MLRTGLKTLNQATLALHFNSQTVNLPSKSPCFLPQFGLPQFSVDKFEGDPADWPEWSSSFKNLIHDNPMLTDSQKLGYLKTYLGAEPKSRVFGFLLEGSNDHLAMKELNQRYGKPAFVI
jgi:hypothetical protein